MADYKHTKGDLQQMQAVPLAGKILMTKRRIREWYDHFDGQVYVSFSGGKDSTVLKHIVDSMYSDVPAVFVNTGLEYPEIQQFVREVKAGKYDCFNPDADILRPEMRFDEVIKKYGYPVASKLVARYVETARRHPDSKRAKLLRGEEWTKFVTGGKWAFLIDAPFSVSDKCCVVMKHKTVNQYEKRTGRKAIIGTMATESPNREQAWRSNGCNAFETKRPTSQPLSFWTEQDVLLYIRENADSMANAYYRIKPTKDEVMKYGKRFVYRTTGETAPYFPKEYGAICSVYGDIVTDDEESGQTTLADFMDMEEFELGRPLLHTTGCQRTGCVLCGFGCHLEKEPNQRFVNLKKTHPKFHNLLYVLKNNGVTYAEAIDWVNEHGGFNIKY